MHPGEAVTCISLFRKYKEDGKKAALIVKESSNVRDD